MTGWRVDHPPGTLCGLGRGPPSVCPQSPRLPATHRSGTPATRLAPPPNGAYRAQASTPPHPPAVHPPGQWPTSPRDKVPRTPSEAPPSRPQLPGKVSTALRLPRPPVPRPGAPTPVPALATLRQRAGGAHRGRGRRGPRRAARGAFPRRPCARSLPGSQSQSLCAEPEPGRQGRWRGEARRGAPASRRSRAAGAPPAGARRLRQ